MVLFNSAIILPALAAISTALPLTTLSPDIDLENSAMHLPNTTSFMPNEAMSLSPLKKETKPPVLGMVLLSSTIILPALAATSTALPLTALSPDIDLENSAMHLPNVTNCMPNEVMSLSPLKKETKPPVLGKASFIAIIILPALAAISTALPLMTLSPDIDLENSAIHLPNATNCIPNEDRFLSPLKNETKPPVLGRDLLSSIIILPALAATSTACPLTTLSPDIDLENLAIHLPSVTNCIPNEAMLLSPFKNETKPPVLGRVLLSSIIILPALAAISTAFPLIALSPDIDLENLDTYLPNATSCIPNEDRFLSPLKKETKPPVLGKAEFNSAIILPALAAAITALPLTALSPDTDFENSDIHLPNTTSREPNESRFLFAVK